LKSLAGLGYSESVSRYNNIKGRALLFLLFLWFLWFINMGVRVVFSPILPLIEDEFLVTHAQASGLFVFQAIGYAVSMLFAGFYSARFGYKKSIAVSLGISCLLFFLIPFVKVFSFLYAFSFLLGIAIGIYLPSALPLITEYFAERHWGKCIAIHDTGASFAIFSMPFLALFFLHFFNWRGIFQLFAFIFLITIGIFCLVTDEVRIKHSERAAFGDLIKTKSLWVMEILFTFAAGANLGLYSVIPLYLTKELPFSIQYANTLLGVSRLGAIAVSVLAGFLIDRLNLPKTLFVSLLVAGIFTILMGLASPGYVAVFLCIQTFVITAFFPAGLVLTAKMFSREKRSMATGLILALSIILGGGVIPYLLGLSADHISFRFGIVILGILVCLSSLLTFYLDKQKQN
jgi:NNP family nitrate/nitrite transporter-like MFS transporter